MIPPRNLQNVREVTEMAKGKGNPKRSARSGLVEAPQVQKWTHQSRFHRHVRDGVLGHLRQGSAEKSRK